jgi:hypothetical protein
MRGLFRAELKREPADALDPAPDRSLLLAVHALVVASQAFLNFPRLGSDQSRSELPRLWVRIEPSLTPFSGGFFVPAFADFRALLRCTRTELP